MITLGSQKVAHVKGIDNTNNFASKVFDPISIFQDLWAKDKPCGGAAKQKYHYVTKFL
jgi:hypothetical protein